MTSKYSGNFVCCTGMYKNVLMKAPMDLGRVENRDSFAELLSFISGP